MKNGLAPNVIRRHVTAMICGGRCRLPGVKNADVIAGSLDGLKWKCHRSLKCAAPSQIADIYFAAMVGSDRVGESRAAHNVGNVALEAMANFMSHLFLILIKKPRSRNNLV